MSERRGHKHRPGPEIGMELLRRIEEVGIERGDFDVLTSEETRERIEARMHYQDTVLVPLRIGQGKVTPELRRYMRRRQQTKMETNGSPKKARSGLEK